MTEREALCLTYLNDLMWSDPHQVGRFVYANLLEPRRGGSNLAAIGAAILGRLRKRGLVAFLPDIQAWRITKEGRAALTTTEGQ